ncbi:unnamed protein product [Owenia fusiformis]|uniref:Uncharacterized protein n=1 Tax=Owenia fusiformis TaxID=6347 RepID=A0A8J1XZ40_OWEFU|nr:unnamed protein product [Owenia fusiformis]
MTQTRQRKKDKNASPNEVLVKFMKTTSIRGLPRIVNSESKIWCVVHILVFLAALGLTLYMVQNILKEYFEYKVTTSVDLSRNTEDTHFPDVTLCNINPHSKTFKDITRETLSKAWSKVDGNTAQKTKDPHKSYKKLLEEFRRMGMKDAVESKTFFHASLSPHELEMSGHKKGDFIRDCKLKDWYGRETPCEMKQLILFRDLDKLNCYTFQLHTQELNATRLQRLRGVSFVLFLAPLAPDVFYEIPENVPSSNGAIVYIHEPNTMPSKSKGFTVSPGFETLVSVSVIHSIQLPAPYGNCKEEFEDIKSGRREFVYDHATCFAKCAQDVFKESCNCSWEEIPSFGDHHPLYCMNMNLPREALKKNDRCLQKARIKLTSHKQKHQCSHCKEKCSTYSYQNSISQSVWPDVSTHLGMYKRYIRKGTACNQLFTEYEDLLTGNGKNLTMLEIHTKLRAYNGVKDSLIKLDVMLNSKDVLTYEQKKIVTLANLLSSLGSTLIFGIGFTYFAFAEIFECLFYFIKSCIKRENRDVQTDSICIDIKGENIKGAMSDKSTIRVTP